MKIWIPANFETCQFWFMIILVYANFESCQFWFILILNHATFGHDNFEMLISFMSFVSYEFQFVNLNECNFVALDKYASGSRMTLVFMLLATSHFSVSVLKDIIQTYSVVPCVRGLC